MRIFLLGVPLPTGGGNTESGDSVLLWKSLGHEVSCLWPAQCLCGQNRPHPANNRWLPILAERGIPIATYTSGKLREVDGLAGSIVVAFACQHIYCNAKELRDLGCRVIWSPCMNQLNVHENCFRLFPPAAVHYQSQYQNNAISYQYREWGIKHHAIIHGAFDPKLFPFNPRHREPGGSFTVGRLSRAALSKWSRKLWPILTAVRKSGANVRFLGMAWTPQLEQSIGPPPAWATCLKENEISSVEFLSRCDALICPNLSDVENWPRIGLECFSTGIPVLADASGGWLEMIQHEKNGFLCKSPEEYVRYLNLLASDESLRQKIIANARGRLAEISDPAIIGAAWNDLFASVA